MIHTDQNFITRLIEKKYPGFTAGKFTPVQPRGYYDSNGYYSVVDNPATQLLYGHADFHILMIGGQGVVNIDIGMIDSILQEEVSAYAFEDPNMAPGKRSENIKKQDILFNQLYFNFQGLNTKVHFYGTFYKIDLIKI